jgi:hypothetical protein
VFGWRASRTVVGWVEFRETDHECWGLVGLVKLDPPYIFLKTVRLWNERHGVWLSRDPGAAAVLRKTLPPGFCAVRRRRPKCLVGAQRERASKKVVHRRAWVLGCRKAGERTGGNGANGCDGRAIAAWDSSLAVCELMFSTRNDRLAEWVAKNLIVVFGFFEGRRFAMRVGRERGVPREQLS